jgi:hypothetical protein
MNARISKQIGFVLLAVVALAALVVGPASAERGFVHGIVLTVDDEGYYFEGPPDGPGGAAGVPRPELAHAVTPGVDFDFMPNWSMPYAP